MGGKKLPKSRFFAEQWRFLAESSAKHFHFKRKKNVFFSVKKNYVFKLTNNLVLFKRLFQLMLMSAEVPTVLFNGIVVVVMPWTSKWVSLANTPGRVSSRFYNVPHTNTFCISWCSVRSRGVSITHTFLQAMKIVFRDFFNGLRLMILI